MSKSILQAQVFEAERIVAELLHQPWHKQCSIIPDYMPPHPNEKTRPKVAIRFNSGTEYDPFLRFSAGPRQGYFWDIYGDDFVSVELAVIALSKAPAPRDVGPITFSLPMSRAT